MEFKLKDARPIWQQLEEQLTERILMGVYPPGARFPSVRELAAEAGVSPNTMQRAITQLETNGLVATNRTAGRSVAADAGILESEQRRLAEIRIRDFFEEMRVLGYNEEEAAALITEKRWDKNGE